MNIFIENNEYIFYNTVNQPVTRIEAFKHTNAIIMHVFDNTALLPGSR